MNPFVIGVLVVVGLVGLWFISTMNRFNVLKIKINEIGRASCRERV